MTLPAFRPKLTRECPSDPLGVHRYRLDSHACISCGEELRPRAVDGLVLWTFTEPLEDDSEVRCPWGECGAWVPVAEWDFGEVACSKCGIHRTLRCPRCGSEFDHVGSLPLEARRVG